MISKKTRRNEDALVLVRTEYEMNFVCTNEKKKRAPTIKVPTPMPSPTSSLMSIDQNKKNQIKTLLTSIF